MQEQRPGATILQWAPQGHGQRGLAPLTYPARAVSPRSPLSAPGIGNGCIGFLFLYLDELGEAASGLQWQWALTSCPPPWNPALSHCGAQLILGPGCLHMRSPATPDSHSHTFWGSHPSCSRAYAPPAWAPGSPPAGATGTLMGLCLSFNCMAEVRPCPTRRNPAGVAACLLSHLAGSHACCGAALTARPTCVRPCPPAPSLPPPA